MATIANKLIPLHPTHPGTLIKDEIEYRGITQKNLAAQMGVSYTVLNEILNAKRPVSAEYALLVEAALGVDAETLTNMQTRYNLQMARQNKKILERFAEIRKVAAML
ncbi:HigA family addiction module antitoxin [Viscerimonas tarda]